MVTDESCQHDHVSRLEGLVFRSEDVPVLEGFHETVDVIFFVGLGVTEVDDDGRLVVVGLGDVRELVVSHYKDWIGRLPHACADPLSDSRVWMGGW